jgi:WD40 repeat protein
VDIKQLWYLESSQAVSSADAGPGELRCCRWSPHSAHTVACCGADGALRMWDVRTQKFVLSIAAHAHEALTLDWDKYDTMTVLTGSAGKGVRT